MLTTSDRFYREILEHLVTLSGYCQATDRTHAVDISKLPIDHLERLVKDFNKTDPTTAQFSAGSYCMKLTMQVNDATDKIKTLLGVKRV